MPGTGRSVLAVLYNVAVAYSTQLARANRVCMMAPRSGGARNWHHDLPRSRLHRTVHDDPRRSAGKNQHVYGYTVGISYESISVSDVLNGFIYLILSSPTCVDAVWCALRPCLK